MIYRAKLTHRDTLTCRGKLTYRGKLIYNVIKKTEEGKWKSEKRKTLSQIYYFFRV